MATAKRVSARRKRVRAKPNAKPQANSRTKPLPRSLARPHGNRLVFSPELLADGKRRYETTAETLDSIALDFSSNRSTLRNVAKHEGWERYVPPPRELPPAARLLAQVDAIGEAASERGEAGNIGESQPPDAPEDVAVTADRLHRALLVELSTVEALRARMKTEPQSPLDAERTARTLSSLTATLQKLQRLHAATPGSNDHDSCYADAPADLDAFRDELARRIRAFVASRAGTRDAGENSGPAAVDDVR